MNARLQRLVRDALEYVPFYSQYWRGFSGSQFTQLPVIRKADLLEYYPRERMDERFLISATRGESTSGSTGLPFEMRIDRGSLRRRRIRFLLALLAVGYRPGQRLMLISDPPFPARASWVNWTYADLRQGEHDVFTTYLRARPDVLYGPLSSLLLLARRIASHSVSLPSPSVVISTAEQLTAAHREDLGRVFKSRIADFYGMTELGLVAFSRSPNRYRMIPGQFHVEFLPAGHGTGLERLIVTDLGGGAMPLIRFDTGDLVRRDHSQPGAPITQICGRVADCLKLSSGGWLSPYEITLALDRVPGIRQYQVVQRQDLGVDLYVASAELNASVVMETARRALTAVCGEATPIAVYERAEQPLRIDEKQRVVCSLAGAL